MANSYVREFQKPVKQVEQLLSGSSVFVKDIVVEEWVPLMRTNNFIQNTLGRNLAYSPTERAFVRMKCDEEGRLEVFQGQPGSLENRMFYNGVVRNIANGTTRPFLTADRLTGNAAMPYTVPEGYKLTIKRGYLSGTSPHEVKLQVQVAGTWVDAKIAFVDSYDELDHLFWVTNPYPAGTALRLSIVNHGATGDFCMTAEGYLEKEVVD